MYRFVASMLVGMLVAFIVTIQAGCVTVAPKPVVGCSEEFSALSKPYLTAGYAVAAKQAGPDYVHVFLQKDSKIVSFIFTTPENASEAKRRGYTPNGTCSLSDGTVSFIWVKELEASVSKAI